MITFNKKNSSNKENTPIISLYNKDDFNDDYKLNVDIKEPRDIIYFDNECDDDDDDEDKDDYVFVNDLGDKTPWPYIGPNQLFRCALCGASGVGKTTTALNFIKMFINANKGKCFIIYFNCNEHDEPLEKYLKKICDDQCIVITPKMMIQNYNDNLKKKEKDKIRLFYTIDDIKNIIFSKANYPVLCAFDDFEKCPNALVKKQMQLTQDEILTTGRQRTKEQKNISCIIINHQVLQGAASKILFNESNYIGLHLRSVSNSNIENVLGIKAGYDNNIIKLLKKMKKRGAGMTFISRTYPYIIMSDKGIIFQC